jgi:hypothetical protein
MEEERKEIFNNFIVWVVSRVINMKKSLYGTSKSEKK